MGLTVPKLTYAAGATARRILRRSELLRRAAVSAVGSAEAVRDRALSPSERWERRASDELTYWRYALTDAKTREARFGDRIKADGPVTTPSLRQALAEIASADVRILDVGSGPLTSAVGRYPGKNLSVVAVDPLADDYVRLLDELHLSVPVLPLACGGEHLLEHFGRDTFDVAFALNALDHSTDPLLVLENMVAVTKPAGRVALTHMRNEGQRNGYMGIHFWNLDCEDGRLVIWNRGARHDAASALREACDVRCWSDEGRVHCVIEPRPAPSPADAAS